MAAEHATRPDRGSRETLWRELRGVVERITYQNPETGFTVARLVPERGGSGAAGIAEDRAVYDERLVALVGTLPDLQPGEAVVARGWWTNDPKHGWQFQAAEYRTTLPATLQGMKRYLGSGLVKGIGPVMAGRIVDAFDEASFDCSRGWSMVSTLSEGGQGSPQEGLRPIRLTGFRGRQVHISWPIITCPRTSYCVSS